MNSMSTYETALKYIQAQLSIIPVRDDGSKQPVVSWAVYQTTMADHETLTRWFSHEAAGIAIVCGSVSGGLEVIDFEANSPAKEWGALVEEELPGLLASLPLVQTPSGGYHLYFRCAENQANQRLAMEKGEDGRPKVMIETRGQGGYIMAPGSSPQCHPSHKTYQLLRGKLTAIPVITPEQRTILLEAARSFNQVPGKPKREVHGEAEHEGRPGDDFNQKAAWEDILTPHGWVVSHHCGEVTYFRRPDKRFGSSATTNHNGSGLFHVFSTNAHPFEPDTAYSKFAAYALLNHGGDFGAAALDLVHKGYGEARADSQKELRLTLLSELLAEQEEALSWVVEGLLPAGGFSLLAGKPKAGKSTLARFLALQVSRGHTVLGRPSVQGPVIYLALEEKRAEVRNHFMAMGAAGNEDIRLYCSTAPAEALEKLKRVITEVKPLLVIIDPLFRFVRVRDSNDYAEVTRSLEPVLSLARETGTHVLCVHHLGKGDRSGGDAILGSTAIFGAVDTVLLLKRTERYRTIASDQRYGQNLEETVLNFDPATRTPQPGGSKEEVEINRVKEAILNYLEGQTEPRTEKETGEEVEARTQLKRKALRELFAEKKIMRQGRGGKADPFRYFCFDVPLYNREQENMNEKTETIAEQYTTYYRPGEFSENHDFEDIDPESLREVVI